MDPQAVGGRLELGRAADGDRAADKGDVVHAGAPREVVDVDVT
jgi:hypothetical protein